MSRSTSATSGASDSRVRKNRALVAAIVREVELIGPNMAEIARRVGESKEKVSYVFRSQILKHGYLVMGRPNRAALGLKGFLAVVDIAPEYSSHATDIFIGMDENWFLSNFDRTIPGGKFLLNFALPEEHFDEYPRLIDGMKKAGLITNVHQVLEFSDRHQPPMSAEFYDFKKGRWDFDWAAPRPTSPAYRGPAPRQRFDSVDLSILVYVMMDAAMPLNEIAKRLRVSTKTAYRHAQHVFDRHLVEFYRIHWQKSQLNQETGTPNLNVHRYVNNILSISGATKREQEQVSSSLNTIPFLWAELLGRDYFAAVCLPPEHMTEGMSFLRRVLAPVSKKTSWYVADPGTGLTFTPPRGVFDNSTGEWVFDVEKQMTLLREQLQAVREESRLVKQAAKYG